MDFGRYYANGKPPNFDTPAHVCPICIHIVSVRRGFSNGGAVDPVGTLKNVPVSSIGTVLFENAESVKAHIRHVHNVDPVDLRDLISHHRIRGEDGLIARYFLQTNDGSDHVQRYWRRKNNKSVYIRMLACVESGQCNDPFITPEAMEAGTNEFMSLFMEDEGSEPELAVVSDSELENNIDSSSSAFQLSSDPDGDDNLRAMRAASRSRKNKNSGPSSSSSSHKKVVVPRRSKKRIVEYSSSSSSLSSSSHKKVVAPRRSNKRIIDSSSSIPDEESSDPRIINPLKYARVQETASSSSVSRNTRSSKRVRNAPVRKNPVRSKRAVNFAPDFNASDSMGAASSGPDTVSDEEDDESAYESEELADDIFLVDKILDHKEVDGKMYYLVKWVGYDDSENTWEPVESFISSHQIDKYLERIGNVDPQSVVPETPQQKIPNSKSLLASSSSSSSVAVDSSSTAAGPSSSSRVVVSESPEKEDSEKSDIDTLIDAYNAVESSASSSSSGDQEEMSMQMVNTGTRKRTVTIFTDGKRNINKLVEEIRKEHGDMVGDIVIISD